MELKSTFSSTASCSDFFIIKKWIMIVYRLVRLPVNLNRWPPRTRTRSSHCCRSLSHTGWTVRTAGTSHCSPCQSVRSTVAKNKKKTADKNKERKKERKKERSWSKQDLFEINWKDWFCNKNNTYLQTAHIKKKKVKNIYIYIYIYTCFFKINIIHILLSVRGVFSLL